MWQVKGISVVQSGLNNIKGILSMEEEHMHPDYMTTSFQLNQHVSF